MSKSQIVISLLLTAHLAAITLAAIPAPDPAFKVEPIQHPTSNDIAATMTPLVDPLAIRIKSVEQVLWKLTLPIRPLVASYTNITGLQQYWAMFSRPPSSEQYFRVRYYVASPSRRTWTATELVHPTHRHDRVRLLRSFRDSYEDKAFDIAFSSFVTARDHGKPREIDPATRPEQLPDDLAPIARYYGRRFRETQLLSDERIIRTEVWHGTAPIPPPGEQLSPVALDARDTVLQRYYAGPIEDRARDATKTPYHGAVQEADITWVLEYYEEQ
ncbi:MAG TPA: hypothetical protein VEK56_15225 [Vicinamibacterales bacterium]|nr:hypothetical protein [Vicinamibacterales bacterium]